MTTGRINQVASQGLRVLGEVVKHGRTFAHAVAAAHTLARHHPSFERGTGTTPLSGLLFSDSLSEIPLDRACSPRPRSIGLLSVESTTQTFAARGPKPLLSGARASFHRS
jgi:hypothetical protein